MLPYLLIGLAAVATVIVLFVIVVSRRPADFRITRSARFTAEPSAAFAQVNDFHNWEHWSPWAKLDPAMQQTYEGPMVGTGAVYTWSGNRQAGQGRMTITESRPSQLIRLKLEFIKPYRATHEVEFTFRQEGGETLMTWDMTGRNNFLAKAFGMLMNIDKLVGGQFEQGLRSIKSLVEQRSRT